MAKIISVVPSRTFSEFLLLPNLTKKNCVLSKVDLKVPLGKFQKGEKPFLELNIPFASAIMQAVSDDRMAITLARCGGISFIFCSQPIEKQAEMVKKVKNFKAGFVVSDSNLSSHASLGEALELIEKTGHSTIAVTDNGGPNGKLLGILTSRDYRLGKCDLNSLVGDFMTPFSSLVYGKQGITLDEANDIIWGHKLNALPIVDNNQNLLFLVFRKDYEEHRVNPEELVDKEKRLIIGAGINTRDYTERVPALIEAGVDVLCVDASDGFSEWQKETIWFVKQNYGDSVLVGGGNVVDEMGFNYLAKAGADFIKVGIGGGSICITREQKGIGMGQPTALMRVAEERDKYFKRNGIYIPICSDGGIAADYHIILALAMGADFVMMGRWFARFDEAPGRKFEKEGKLFKKYWGEGTDKARNWDRYCHETENSESKKEGFLFEEGVDACVPYAGRLKDNLDVVLGKIKATMTNCGAINIRQFQKKSRLVLVSPLALEEGKPHDVFINEIK